MRRLRGLWLLLVLPLAAFALREDPVTVWIAGDSTAAEKLPEKRPETGWGEMLQQYFDPQRVRIANRARNGRSTRTFISEGRWRAIADSAKAGDYVFIQFGHNDASPDKVDRYTPPDAYRANLARMVADVRAKGATPVLLTPVMRRRFDSAGAFYDAHGEYPGIVREVAAAQRVALLDMHRTSEQVLRRYGAEPSKRLFLHLAPGESPNYPQGLRDDTHFSPEGAGIMATLAVEGIRELRLPLAELLNAAGRAATPPSPAPVAPAGRVALLDSTRIAALPAAERAAWERYIATSRRLMAADRASVAAELRTLGRERRTPAPSGQGFSVTREMTAEWLRGAEGRRMADAVLSYQTPSGGWSKRVELAKGPRAPGQSYAEGENWHYVGTFDNGATTEHLRFLLRADSARPDERYRRSFLRGVDYVLAAQFPSGCWPQVYPLEGGYHDAATFNDDAMVRVLRLLQPVARGEAAFVPAETREKARSAVQRGVDCILAGQVVLNGRRTAWGQQHDPLTLAPVAARSFEPASLTAHESAAIVTFLVSLDPPDPRVAAAVHGAVAWFRENALYGYEYADQKLAAKPAAGPLWARMYELGTQRPVFVNRDGVVRYAFGELDDRSTGYAWYSTAPASALRRYDAWSRRHGAAPADTRARPAPAAVVDARYTGPEGAVDGSTRRYRTIARALADAPAGGAAPYVISLRDGRYHEKLSVETPNVHLVGESREGTVLTYDAAAGAIGPSGAEYGTRGSFTLRVAAPDFRLEGMTVENGWDYAANAAKPDSDRTKLRGSQAVAVFLDVGSDRAVFRDCRITGHQDTLFPNAGRSYFNRCEIVGSVDFIFGAGRAVFEECDIVSRDRGSRTNNGYVTAPSTPVSQPFGFLFVRGRLKKERPEMAPSSVTLGRPWHPSGRPDAIGSAVFIDTWMDDHVGAAGWSPMNSRDAAGHTVENRPEDARFFEHGTTGPGAVASPSRRVLTPEEARRHTVAAVLDGWDPGR